MNLEHLGLNHPDPVAAADWYVKHLQMKVTRQFGAPGHGRFLADAKRGMMVEFYLNSTVPPVDFRAIPGMSMHLAFHVSDITTTRAQLIAAGAKPDGEVTTNADGDKLALLRDPWGLTIQLVTRTTQMI